MLQLKGFIDNWQKPLESSFHEHRFHFWKFILISLIKCCKFICRIFAPRDINIDIVLTSTWLDFAKSIEQILSKCLRSNAPPRSLLIFSLTIIILVTITATYIIIVVVRDYFLGSSVNWKFVNNWYYFLGVLTQKQDWNITIYFPLNSNLLDGQKKWRCFLSSQDILLYQAQTLFL